MPEKLLVHSGERVDLVDYVHGSNTYTSDADKFALERMWLDRRARVLEGFRIRIEDQTAFPGMITVFNGNALDRDGQLLNNEQTVNDSRSITLLGASLTFYLEIEFVENESDTDARYFWDPTSTNTAPEPDGSEFALNVATRVTPDWRIVSPVSTTAFEQTSDASSLRVPLAVLATDASNRVSTGVTNPGLVLVFPASVLEEDVSAADVTLRVLDARVFPATLPFNITVDLGAPTSESRTVTSLDRTNGICTISVPLTDDHNAGAIVQVTTGSAEFVSEKTDPSDPALDSMSAIPGHPDLAQRMWQANEVRGSGILVSKETYGARDDLNIRNLKDYVDFLSAQVRELKFGSPRPEEVNTAPPVTFDTRPRYFDPAGSVQGARSNSVSIGNGTTTFGDFNDTDGSAALTAAIAALPALGGTIFIKAGTYDFATSVSVTKTVRIVGEGIGSTILNVTNAGGAGMVLTASTTFESMTIQAAGGAASNTVDVTSAVTLGFSQVVFTGQVNANNVAVSVRAYRASFIGVSVNPVFLGTGTGSLTNSEFISCIFTAAVVLFISLANVHISGAVINTISMVGVTTTQTVTDFKVDNSTISAATAVFSSSGSGDVDGFFFDNCRITVSALPAGGSVFSFTTSGETNRLQLTNLVILITGGTSSTAAPAFVLHISAASSSRKVLVDNIDVDAAVSSVVRAIHFDQSEMLGKTEILNSFFYRTQEMLRLGGATGGMNTSGTFIVDSCVHDNDNEHDDVQGIVLDSDPEFRRLEVLNSVFKSYGKSLGAGVRIGLNLGSDATPLGETTYVVRGCFFYDLWGSGATTAAGVYYTSTTGNNCCFQISESSFETISGDTSSISAGVYISNTSLTTNAVNINNNHIVDIGGVLSGAAYGVYANGVANIGHTKGALNITGNRIRGVESSDAASPASGIQISASGPVLIQDNYISECAAPTGTIALTGCGIRVNDASSLRGVQISNNRIDQNIAGTAASQRGSIILYVTNLDGYVIANNTVVTSTTPLYGIYVAGQSGSSAIRNGLIANNIVQLLAASASDCRGISVALGGLSQNLNIIGNIVEETTYDASGSLTRKGISVTGEITGGETRNISVTGNIVLGVKSGALISSALRIGIIVQDAHNTNVSNNIVDWLEPSVVEGIGIRLASVFGGPWEGHVCVGNLVRADNTSAAGDTISINSSGGSTVMIDGVLTGNNAGTTAAAGTITAVTGGWVYGTNLT